MSATGEARPAGGAHRVLFLLFLVNFLNFFDRTLPAVVNEPIRHEWGLSDLQLGLVASAFTIIYAIAGVPLGRLSDTKARSGILGSCLLVWSGLTAATAGAWSYASFFMIRVGVGVGEAGCAPAASSMIGDLFPPNRRARAIGLFMLGLPMGLWAAFFGGGMLVRAFGNWRGPFLVAAVPGILLGIAMFFVAEPARGAADGMRAAPRAVDKPIRRILGIRTVWWIILSGISVNFAAYAGNGFMVSLLQRYFAQPIATAANNSGLIVGMTGILGLTIGGFIADRIHQRSARGRLVYGALCLLLAAPATWIALQQEKDGAAAFSVLFGLGWFLYYSYYTTTYAALQDVVEPRLRATAMALYFAGMYVLGGSLGPTVVGGLSDRLARAAMRESGAAQMTAEFKARGLHDAMQLIPVMFLVTGVAMFLASLSFERDAEKMKAELAAGDSGAT